MPKTDPRAAVAEPYRARLLPMLEALVAIGPLAEEQGWVNVGWPTEAQAPNFSDEAGDAVVVMRDDIRDLHAPPYVPIRCCKLDFDPVRVAIQMLGLSRPETGGLDGSPKFYARHLDQLARARYALVVCTHEIRLPQVDGSQFEAGRVDGAGLLYEISTRALRGGFEIHVENSWQLKGSDRTIDDKLRADLEAKFSLAVVRLIGDHFPAGRAPATLGYV